MVQQAILPTLRSLRHLYPELVALAAFGDVEEQLVERDATADQALLLRIRDQPLEVWGVALTQAVFPWVLAEDALLLLPRLPVPGERNDARVLHAAHRDRLGLVERLVEV